MDILKNFIFILTFSYFSFTQAVLSQTFEIYQSDTINKTDALNKKQDRWITFHPGNTSKIEKEGFYENNRKTGLWKTYYLNGNLKSEITYKNNLPEGFAKFYYENGKPSEEGMWKGTMWVGSYNYYHENGNKAYEWNFNDNGKRTGVQKYYYENGQLLIKGDWADGKENGTITEYYENGTIKSEKVFASGQINSETSKFYAVKKVSVEDIPDDTNTTVSLNQNETNSTVNANKTFDGNGFHKLYNAFKKLDREGEFKNGQLLNGKRYYYNSDGVLLKTAVYKRGIVSEIIKEN